jgi:uncharacterized protein
MQKIVLVIIAVIALLWLLRGLGRRQPPTAPPSKPPPPAVQDMVACAHCGVHLPASDALPGRGGVFCGAAHREAFERDHPQP